MENMFNLLVEETANGDKDKVIQLVKDSVNKGCDPGKIMDSLIKGIELIGEKWMSFEAYIPDVMLAAEAMNEGQALILDVLKEKGINRSLGNIVLGTVKGDVHDIGKNIVGTILSAAGFTVYDIGIDQPAGNFIEKAEKVKAHIIAVSALLTTTLQGQKDVIDLLVNKGLRNKYKVIVGGGPVTQEWADLIGADGYGETGAHAVRICKEIMRCQ